MTAPLNLPIEKESLIMDKTNKLTFENIEFILRVLEKEKANTTDQARLQMIEAIVEKIKKSTF